MKVKVSIYQKVFIINGELDPRYLAAGDTLLIREASPSDAVPYGCLARHPHSDLVKRSGTTALNVIRKPTTLIYLLVRIRHNKKFSIKYREDV